MGKYIYKASMINFSLENIWYVYPQLDLCLSQWLWVKCFIIGKKHLSLAFCFVQRWVLILCSILFACSLQYKNKRAPHDGFIDFKIMQPLVTFGCLISMSIRNFWYFDMRVSLYLKLSLVAMLRVAIVTVKHGIRFLFHHCNERNVNVPINHIIPI